MNRGNLNITELSASEIQAVSGGFNLDGYRTSENVEEQYWQKEGNMWVLYSSRGVCLATSFTSPY